MQIAKAMQQAIEQAESGQNENAAEQFNSLLLKYPEDAQVQYNAGIFFSQSGEHIKAADCFLKAAELMPTDVNFKLRGCLECFQVGGGQVMTSDFLAYDIGYLVKAETILKQILETQEHVEARDLLNRVNQHSLKNRLAFRFMDGDLDYCRQTLARKKELTNLDQRVMGFLNLLDSGEYLFEKGRFMVTLKDNLPQGNKQGFLERIRNMVLGK